MSDSAASLLRCVACGELFCRCTGGPTASVVSASSAPVVTVTGDDVSEQGSAASTSTTKRYWLCQGCGTRNPRQKIKCLNPDCNRRRPKRRVPAHARTLRDDPYPVYEALNADIHAAGHGAEWSSDHCGVCGKPPTTRRHMDRDHDHTTGKPRGLACPGNQGCNALMPRHMTVERARQVLAYLERVEAYNASQGLTDAV